MRQTVAPVFPIWKTSLDCHPTSPSDLSDSTRSDPSTVPWCYTPLVVWSRMNFKASSLTLTGQLEHVGRLPILFLFGVAISIVRSFLRD